MISLSLSSSLPRLKGAQEELAKMMSQLKEKQDALAEVEDKVRDLCE